MTVLIFIAVLVTLILVHEFGHFIFAKAFKVKVEEFGIGYPPKAFTLAKIGGTEYTLNWLPFGGFVKLFGENRDEDDALSQKEKEQSFEHKKTWQKLLILFAGPFFNFLLGWLLFSVVYFSGVPLFWDQNYVENAKLTISETLPNAPAHIAGVRAGDVLLKMHLEKDKTQSPKLLSPDYVAAFIAKHPGEKIYFEFQDTQGNIKKLSIIPSQGIIQSEPSRAAVGMSMTLVSKRSFGALESLWLGLKATVQVSKDVLYGLYNLAKGAVTFTADLKQVAGPVGIASMVGDAASVGFAYLLYFMALISVNLAIINLLPIPALDGGRMLFEALAAIFRRRIPAAIENGLNFAGFALLLILMLAITYNDIVRLLNS